MAFKIAMKAAAPQAAPPQEDPTQNPEEAQESPEEEASEQQPDGDEGDIEQSGGPVDPQIAGYQGPENGPFMCGNCVHFDGGEGCAVVSGKIDHMGCCNMFTSAGLAQQGGDDETQEAAPEEQEEPQDQMPPEEEEPQQ